MDPPGSGSGSGGSYHVSSGGWSGSGSYTTPYDETRSWDEGCLSPSWSGVEWWRPNAGRGWGWTGAWGNESYTDPGPGSDWPDWPDEPGSGGPGDPGPTEPPPDPAPRPESPPWGDDAGVFWTTAFDEGSVIVAPAEPGDGSSIFDRLARPGGGVSAGVAAALNFAGAGDAGGGGGARLDAFGAGREANADQDSWWGVASAVGSMVVGAALDPVGTAYDSAVGAVEEWRTVWRNVGETEASLLGRVYITGGTTLASLAGIRQLSDFWTGVDAVDGHAQSFVENVLDGTTGIAALVLTGVGGYYNIKPRSAPINPAAPAWPTPSETRALRFRPDVGRISGRNPPISPRQVLHTNGTPGKSQFNPGVDVEGVVRTAWEAGTRVLDKHGKFLGKRFTFNKPIGTSPTGYPQHSVFVHWSPNNGIHGVPTTVGVGPP